MAANNQVNYNEPWILQRADPYVFFKDGYYYFTASVPTYDGIILRRSKTLNGLAEAEEKEVWHKHESGLMSEHVWAPEIHYLFGNGTFILQLAKRKISGISALMYWSVRDRIHIMIHGLKKAR